MLITYLIVRTLIVLGFIVAMIYANNVVSKSEAEDTSLVLMTDIEKKADKIADKVAHHLYYIIVAILVIVLIEPFCLIYLNK